MIWFVGGVSLAVVLLACTVFHVISLQVQRVLQAIERVTPPASVEPFVPVAMDVEVESVAKKNVRAFRARKSFRDQRREFEVRNNGVKDDRQIGEAL